MNWPRATASTSSGVSATSGKRSRPVSIGRSRRADRGRIVGGGRAHGVERDRVGLREGPGGRSPQRAEVRGAARAAPRGRAPAPGCTCRPSSSTSSTAIGRSGSLPSQRRERGLVDRDLPLGELDGLAGAGHRVGAPAADLDRRVGRRALRDRAGQRRAAPPRPPRGSARARSPGVSSPSRSSVDDEAPKQTVAR